MSGREGRRRAAGFLIPVLALAAAVGAAVGVIAGWRFLVAGFPLLLVASIVRWLSWSLAGGALFLALEELLRRLWVRFLPAAGATVVAAALAAAPLAAAAGYRHNRDLGIRPSQLLQPYGLKANLGFLVLCAAVYGVLCLILLRWRPGPRASARGVRAAVTAALVLAIAHGALALSFKRPAKSRPDVLLILVDALRADELGAYGYPRPTTPAMDALAADGVLFRQAVSQSTFTKSSIASLFTGRFPYQHGVYWGSLQETPGSVTSDLLAPEETTLAELLAGRGYLTAAWVQNSHLRGFMGFGQGFVDYRDQQGHSPRISRIVRRWLGRAGRRYPFFAYLHYIDLHDPYRPPPPYDTLFGRYADVYAGVDFAEWGSFLAAVRSGERRLAPAEVEQLRAYYDGQLRFVDEHVGRLLDRLKEEGLYDSSLVILTADHGDAFYEHGFISHSTTPYEELVQVPLIVKLPGGRGAGTVVEEQVRLVDVLPTVLDVLGYPVPAEVAGCSLLPLVDGGGTERDAACSTAIIEIAEDGAYPVVAVRTAAFKYIHHESKDDELYDLRADPGERTNLALAGDLPEAARPLRDLALEVVTLRAEAGDRIELDEKSIQELKALGYIE